MKRWIDVWNGEIRRTGSSRTMQGPPQGTSVKNRIRSLRRLLQNPDLPPQARKDKTRLLRKLEKKLREQKLKEREKKRAMKYHKVRFFERVKVERALKKVEKALEEGDDAGKSRNELEEERERLLQDLAYIRWFPKGEKYISLFPKGDVVPGAERMQRWLKTWALANAQAQAFLPEAPLPRPPRPRGPSKNDKGGTENNGMAEGDKQDKGGNEEGEEGEDEGGEGEGDEGEVDDLSEGSGASSGEEEGEEEEGEGEGDDIDDKEEVEERKDASGSNPAIPLPRISADKLRALGVQGRRHKAAVLDLDGEIESLVVREADARHGGDEAGENMDGDDFFVAVDEGDEQAPVPAVPRFEVEESFFDEMNEEEEEDFGTGEWRARFFEKDKRRKRPRDGEEEGEEDWRGFDELHFSGRYRDTAAKRTGRKGGVDARLASKEEPTDATNSSGAGGRGRGRQWEERSGRGGRGGREGRGRGREGRGRGEGRGNGRGRGRGRGGGTEQSGGPGWKQEAARPPKKPRLEAPSKRQHLKF